jgi:vitamin B12/bleomycin/antimicrobial peptide transport system ATP-binding/permease protein
VSAAVQTEERVPIDRLTWVRFGRAVRSFVSSEVGWKARSLFAVLMLFLFAINGLNVVNSYVARDFMTAIANRDRAGFVWQATVYVGVFMGSTLVAVLYRFSEERLAVLWREWLTKLLVGLYLTLPAYLQLEARSEIANPDQRIADDTRAFTTTTLSFVLMVSNASFTVVAFAGVLWSISTLLFVVAVAYAALGSLLTVLLGGRLVWLNYTQLDKEANFRSDLIHVRQHAESVALLHGEGRLGARLRRRIEDLTANWRRIIAVNRNLSFFTTGYNYMIQIIPALIIAPLFIRGEVQFGVITQSAMAFSMLLGAFSLIVNQFQSISSFAAVVARLSSLVEAVEHAQSRPCMIETREENDRVAYERLTLRSPTDGRTLVRELSASLPSGTRLLLRAHPDAGGVALFLATAGIWGTGEGRIIRPGLDAIHFLPERPYLALGTLRECLLGSGQGAVVSEAQIRGALRLLRIEDLVERAGGLDVEKEWEDVFSLGEQQLLAVARVLLAAPQFVFLDRLDSALDAEHVALVLKVLSEQAVTYVAFKGDGDVARYYDAILEIAEDGSWQWKSLHVPHA